MTPKHGGLYMHIDHDLGECICPTCEGKGWYGDRNAFDPTCERCDGTGRVTRRLVGWVPVECDCNRWDGSSIEYEYLGNFKHDVATSPEDMADIIIAAYLDGTLPPELAVGLEEMDT